MTVRRSHALFAALLLVSPLPAQTQQLGTSSRDDIEQFFAALPIPQGAAERGGQPKAPTDDARWLTVPREWAQASDPIPDSQTVAGGGSATPQSPGDATAARSGQTAQQQRSGSESVGSRRAPGGGGGSRTRIGETTINAHARDVTTVATSGNAETSIGVREGGTGRATITATTKEVVTQAIGGDATTKIGVRTSGGGNTTVSAGTTITRSVGGSATTEIGGEAGTVVTGTTYNQGGTLTIGASGTTRNGMRCLEIFRQTCIIHIYYRRHSDPCAPGYWMDIRRCLLPSDLRHKIVR